MQVRRSNVISGLAEAALAQETGGSSPEKPRMEVLAMAPRRSRRIVKKRHARGAGPPGSITRIFKTQWRLAVHLDFGDESYGPHLPAESPIRLRIARL